MKFRFASSLFLTLFCLAVSGIGAHADVLYNNGVGSEFAANVGHFRPKRGFKPIYMFIRRLQHPDAGV